MLYAILLIGVALIISQDVDMAKIYIKKLNDQTMVYIDGDFKSGDTLLVSSSAE